MRIYVAKIIYQNEIESKEFPKIEKKRGKEGWKNMNKLTASNPTHLPINRIFIEAKQETDKM